MNTVKFLVIVANTSENDVTIVCQDGGVAYLHNNGNHMLATLCQERITVDTDFENLFETIVDFKQSIRDYTESEPTAEMIQDCMNYLFASTENYLHIIEYKDYDGEFDELMGGNSHSEWIEEFIKENNTKVDTIEKVINVLGSRGTVSNDKVIKYVESNKFNDDFIADIYGYYLIEINV